MPTEIDWSQTKFRASSWGNLMTEPKTKEEKLRGELSVTCKKELIKIYNMVKYGRKKDISSRAIEKGKLCEKDGIILYSRVEKKLYSKNEVQLENEWFTGFPDLADNEDIYKAKEVDDMKISYELDTFMPKLIEEADAGYEYQLNVYYDLAGPQCEGGSIVYALVSAPESLILQEKRSLLWKMDVATDLNPDYIAAAEELERNMVFEDIDFRERIIKKPVPRDNELIQKMKDKVPRLREWLMKFEILHLKRYVNTELV